MDYVTSNGRLSEKDSRKFFRQIVSGLSHIHDSNVVHRDLKLENILLDKNRNVLISDFGLGRTFDPESTENMMTFCGTPNYAAVELVMGNPYNGIKSDIWSLGVILYILVTGQRPFVGPTVGILYKRIMSLEYEKPNYLSEDIMDLFAKIFVKDPKKRIDMESIRNHPWICSDEGQITMHLPKTNWEIDEAVLSKGISSVGGDRNYTIYTFNSFTKLKASTGPLSSISEKEKKDHIPLARARRKSISICQTEGKPEELKSSQPAFRTRRKTSAHADKGIKLSNPFISNSSREQLDLAMLKRNQGVTDENIASSLFSGSFTKSTSKGSLDFRSVNDSSSSNPVPSCQQSTDTIESTTNPPIISRRNSGTPHQHLEEFKEPGVDILVNSRVLAMDITEIPSVITLHSRRGSARSNETKDSISTQRKHSGIAFELSSGSRRGSAERSTESAIIQVPGSMAETANASKLELKGIRKPSLSHIAESPKLERSRPSFFSLKQSGNNNTSAEQAVQDSPKLERPRPSFSAVRQAIANAIAAEQPPKEEKKSKGRQRSNSELLARDAAMFRRMSMVGPDLTEENIPESSSEGINSINVDQKHLEEWHLIHRPPKQIRSMRFPFRKGQFSTTLDPATMFQDLHKSLMLIQENHVFSHLYFKRVPDYYLFECFYNSGADETALKFEVEICEISLLKMHALRIKRIKGDLFDFQKLHSDILENVNWG
jgi:serine/threonine protein kinase